ncbi:unnamed protein product [Sphenostylis stenocarpa]|uniref:Uncharacterized protein n=1 Tax=Sphenostylis stenocarpa TaxID=92480 RepID=A0AA86V5E0_9FABA|nr:unnamed protein product [Sphenostylis stenocarpa]
MTLKLGFARIHSPALHTSTTEKSSFQRKSHVCNSTCITEDIYDAVTSNACSSTINIIRSPGSKPKGTEKTAE